MLASLEDMWVVGVDLGGTKIKAGLICGDRLEKTAKNNLPEDKDTNAQSVIDTIIKTIEQVFTKSLFSKVKCNSL